MSTAGAHILMYPFPGSGHIIPLIDLTHRLLTAGHTITVLVTPNDEPLLEPLIARHGSSVHPLVFPFPVISSSSTFKRLISIMRGFRELHQPLFLKWFKEHPSPPVAIVSDFFCGCAQDFASQVGIKNVVFSPSGALSWCTTVALWRDLKEMGNDGGAEDEYSEVSFPSVPNCPTYPLYQISSLYRTSKQGDPDWEFYRANTLCNLSSWGFVFNSFTELERVYLDHLKKELGHDRVWGVGPILPPHDTKPSNRGGLTSLRSHEVMTWLDRRETDSVVYVCFGSRVILTGKQMSELVAGLEKSGVYFVFCVKDVVGSDIKNIDRNDDGIIPRGFEERVADRGFVIKGWAPQVAILRHRAVGAFVSHCGWNSTLEGLTAGVVMLTWPMVADQFTNAKILVDELGVGIRVGEETRKIPESTELGRLLDRSINGCTLERERAKRFSEVALGSVNGGSSYMELSDFCNKVNELIVK